MVSGTIFADQSFAAILEPTQALGLLVAAVLYTLIIALRHEVLWLAALAALIGFLSPWFSGDISNPWLLLSYLLVLSVTIIWAGLKLNSRCLNLLLIVGIFTHLYLLLVTNNFTNLWTAVILFSALLLFSVNLTIYRFNKAVVLDILALILIAASYLILAASLATNSGIATFGATLVIALSGYFFYKKNFAPGVVALYVALAAVGILVSTTFLLSGFSLIIAYAIQITAAFLLSTQLGLPERVVWVVATLYLLPIICSVNSLLSEVWDRGIWHAETLAVGAVLTGLWVSTLWLIYKPGAAIYQSSIKLVVCFSLATFIYTYVVVFALAEAIFNPPAALVMTYVAWATLSLALVLYVAKQEYPLRVVTLATLTLAIPTIASVESFFASGWTAASASVHLFGLSSLVGIFLLTILFLTQLLRRDYDPELRGLIGWLIVTGVVYFAFTLNLLFKISLALDLAIIATYFSLAVLLYLVISVFVLVGVKFSWLQIALTALAVPIIYSFNSVSFSGYVDGLLDPHAVGLISLASVLLLVALGLRKHQANYVTHTQGLSMKDYSSILLCLALVYAAILVWSLAYSYLSDTGALALALAVYAGAGLVTYFYIKRSKARE